MLINPPQPVHASTIEGEPCSIWWVDKSVDGWPFVTVTWVDSCPRSCPQDVAGDFYNQSDTWCADLTPPPNLPGVYLGNACSASTSRTVTLITDGTFGTNFEIEGNGQVVAGTSHTFTGIPEGLFTARGQAHNSKGVSGWSSPVSAQHDYSAPVTTSSMVGLTQNGWYVSPVSVSFNANDVGCFGVNQTIYAVNGVQNSYSGSPFTIADDGIHTLQYRSTDGYHLEAEKSGIIPIDSTAPTLQFVLDRPQDVAGWWTAPLSITIFADDATSGLVSLDYDLNGAGWVSGDSLTLTDGVHTLDAQATDNAGHLSYDGVILPIDSIAPLLTVQIMGEQGENSWFITPPTLTLSATDATSGLAGILYQVENGSQTLYTAPLRFTREGLYTVQAFAVDNAQHITTQTVQIGYDITPPQTNAQLTETEGGMIITLNRWDGVSGFALTRMAINGVWGDYHAPVTVSEVGDYWVQFYTIDFAGNIETEKIVSFTIAETGVVITQAPPLVNIIPPANPPTTPPFETREDFPPDLHDEGVYFTYPEDNRVADTAYPPSQIIFAGGNANNGSPVVTMENRISRSPVIRESDMTTNTIPLFPLEGRFPTDRQPRISTLPYIRSESFEPNRMGEDYVDTTLAPQPTSNVVFVTDTTSAQGASETPSSPLDVTMLAMLGLTMAGAGVMKSQSAQKKQQELAQVNAVAQAQLATAKAEQAQTASANWEQNQTMQANATQKVYTKVQQSQANIDFWVSYTAWKIKVAEAEEKRRQAELEARIKAYYAALRLRPVSSQPAQPLQPSWAARFTRARAMQINRRNNASQSGVGSSAGGGGGDGSSETSKPISSAGNAKMAGTNSNNAMPQNKGGGFLGLGMIGNFTTTTNNTHSSTLSYGWGNNNLQQSQEEDSLCNINSDFVELIGVIGTVANIVIGNSAAIDTSDSLLIPIYTLNYEIECGTVESVFNTVINSAVIFGFSRFQMTPLGLGIVLMKELIMGIGRYKTTDEYLMEIGAIPDYCHPDDETVGDDIIAFLHREFYLGDYSFPDHWDAGRFMMTNPLDTIMDKPEFLDLTQSIILATNHLGENPASVEQFFGQYFENRFADLSHEMPSDMNFILRDTIYDHSLISYASLVHALYFDPRLGIDDVSREAILNQVAIRLEQVGVENPITDFIEPISNGEISTYGRCE